MLQVVCDILLFLCGVIRQLQHPNQRLNRIFPLLSQVLLATGRHISLWLRTRGSMKNIRNKWAAIRSTLKSTCSTEYEYNIQSGTKRPFHPTVLNYPIMYLTKPTKIWLTFVFFFCKGIFPNRFTVQVLCLDSFHWCLPLPSWYNTQARWKTNGISGDRHIEEKPCRHTSLFRYTEEGALLLLTKYFVLCAATVCYINQKFVKSNKILKCITTLH